MRIKLFLAVIAATFLACKCEKTPTTKADMSSCVDKAEVKDGIRRVAFLVGVGKYKNGDISRLYGPPKDVQAMKSLLINQYGFPEANVCVLLDEQATVAAFKSNFKTALIDRVEKPEDVAVVFFSGHGSQSRDAKDGGDEQDGWDETWVLHDSRTQGVGDLLDDEVRAELLELAKKTKNVTVILDSCNSGTATRAADENGVVARLAPAPDGQGGAPVKVSLPIDGRGPLADELEHIVVLSASSDGVAALESRGSGVFTDALVEVLGLPERLDYAQVSRRAAPLVTARGSPQVPHFQGPLERFVFDSKERKLPLSWEVRKEEPLEIAGPPLAGISPGAELRIYDKGLAEADFRNPARAKALVVVTSDSQAGSVATTARLKLVSSTEKPKLGDLAVLVRPGNETIKVSVRPRPADQQQGVSEAKVAALKQALQGDPDAKQLVQLVSKSADFELFIASNGSYALAGPEDSVRAFYATEQDVAKALWGQARARALLALKSEPGGLFKDDETIKVELKAAPDANQTACGRSRVNDLKQVNGEWIVPACVAFQVQATVTGDQKMYLGGVAISSDGSTLGFRSPEVVGKGRPVDFGQVIVGGRPFGVPEKIRVFGTRESNMVRWDLLTLATPKMKEELAKEVAPAGDDRGDGVTRGSAESALQRALRPYLAASDDRGLTDGGQAIIEDSEWTSTTVTVRVMPNAWFEQQEVASGQPQPKEYTLSNFDVRPYLPDDESTALYKVLTKGEELAHRDIQYKQHQEWEKPGRTDEQNLMVGIDCSRSIWFAFTRSGLPYNKQNDKFLPTVEMVAPSTPMADYFDRCDNAGLMPGDVLVYRDEGQGDGHVVMVIDPVRRIAWGSHGWDGNVKPGQPQQRGVEYQLIKFKKDWARWDRPTMDLKACWRYRTFAEEAKKGTGVPGVKAFNSATCRLDRCGLEG